jgi:CheY-like chemotaxis protein
VRSAGSAEEALARLADGHFDVLVTDIAMPREDGFSLVERLAVSAREDGSAAIPAIAVTAYAREEDRARALASGFAAHVSKPVDESVLITTIAALCGGVPRAQPRATARTSAVP